MITSPTVTKTSIRRHYDLLSPFYRLFWGRHIHHGLFDSPCNRSVAAAQLLLTDTLAIAAGIEGGHRVLDVGCGLGGSAIHLAQRHRCHVTGVTLSRVQRLWASLAARRHGVTRQTCFLAADAETCDFPPSSFDRLWSVECTEHFFDKPGFFSKAAGWLRPGGRVALCAWLAGDEPLDSEQRRLVEQVCEGMFCPSLGTASDYEQWLVEAGLDRIEIRDWTGHVARTWDICLERIRRSGVQYLAALCGGDIRLFVSHFETMITAYRTGALRYGAITARKPSP